MRAFGFSEEFFCVGFVVLVFFHAGLAIPKPRLAAIQSQGADELPSVASSGLVRASHYETEMLIKLNLSLYAPTGVFNLLPDATVESIPLKPILQSSLNPGLNIL